MKRYIKSFFIQEVKALSITDELVFATLFIMAVVTICIIL